MHMKLQISCDSRSESLLRTHGHCLSCWAARQRDTCLIVSSSGCFSDLGHHVNQQARTQVTSSVYPSAECDQVRKNVQAPEPAQLKLSSAHSTERVCCCRRQRHTREATRTCYVHFSGVQR